MGVNEVEYESDTEGSLALALRRREASDDEEEEEEEEGRGERIPQGFVDEESEDEGAAPPLEDEEEDEEEEIEEEYEEDVVERIMVRGREEEEGDGGIEGLDEGDGTEIHHSLHPSESGGGNHSPRKDDQGIASPRNKDQVEEEKKEAEPFAVPTAGAFYMHDDRFRDNGGARPRRSAGGRKLWEAKDDRAWVHDRFEELNLQDDMRYEEGQRRGGRGRFKGRGRGRGGGRGQGRGNKSRIFEDGSVPAFVRRGGGRGRGSRRNEGELKSAADRSVASNKQASKVSDTMPSSSAGKTSSRPGTGQFDSMNSKKHVIGSSLNSASPPFYPSGSQHQNIVMSVKREQQYGGTIASTPSSAVMTDEERGTSNTALNPRSGKNTVASRGQVQSHVEPALHSSVGKQTTNMQLQASRASSVNLSQQQQSKVQGRSPMVAGQPSNHPMSSGSQINKGSNVAQVQSEVQQRQVQTQAQGGSRTPSQQSIQQTSGSNQTSPGPSSSEVGNAASPPGSNKNRNVGVGRGRGPLQGAGRGSYMYSGTQAVGGTSPMSVAHAEQSFPHTPALLPVMQFGGQHHAGLGVPAVGMALPGYVAQPQLGFGNSEMTWVPVLAGAAGALGATYCSPYIAVDGAYYAQPTAQPSSFGVAGRDSNGNKPPSMWKPTPRSDLVNDEFGQRQNKPRRYSEMNFGQ
eukprot:Gb_31197 [translate_table: standard]